MHNGADQNIEALMAHAVMQDTQRAAIAQIKLIALAPIVASLVAVDYRMAIEAELRQADTEGREPNEEITLNLARPFNLARQIAEGTMQLAGVIPTPAQQAPAQRVLRGG